jgi:hypothetical protein
MDKKMNENNNEMKINMEEMKKNIDKNMDENMEEIKIYMKELQNSMSSLAIQTLDEKLPKGDIKMT